MKRRRADPGFVAAYDAAMQRLNADPAFKAANSARMQRRNADPVFRAKQRLSRAIPDATRAAIIAALRADPNPKRVAAKIGGVSYWTVLRIARAAGIRPTQSQSARRLRDKADDFHFVDVHIGARLRKRRKQAGIATRRLANVAGVCFQQIAKYERGAARISPGRLYRFAQLLDVPIGYFFQGLPGARRRAP
jgi:hypothetical protein